MSRDPDSKTQDGTRRRHHHGDGDAAVSVTDVADDWTAKDKTEVEDSAGDGPLLRGEANGGGIVGERVEEGDVAQVSGDAPDDDEEDLEVAEVAVVEGSLTGLGARAGPVFEEEGGDEVGAQGAKSEDAVGGLHAHGLDGAASG